MVNSGKGLGVLVRSGEFLHCGEENRSSDLAPVGDLPLAAAADLDRSSQDMVAFFYTRSMPVVKSLSIGSRGALAIRIEGVGGRCKRC